MDISIPNFLNSLRFVEYVVFKRSDIFPNFTAYSDVDIIVMDLLSAKNSLIAYASNFSEPNYRVEMGSHDGHFHLDIYKPASAESLTLRFDVSSTNFMFPTYGIKSEYWQILFERRKCEIIEGKNIFFPSEIDECVLRFLEYLSNRQRPEKIKHLKYIKNRGCSNFLDVLSKYTLCQMTETEIKRLINAA